MVLKLADRIRFLRDKAGMTQTALAKSLGISRSAFNSWEMSLSSPTIANVIEMSKLFHVSVEYILSSSERVCVDITDLDNEEQEVIIKMVDCLMKGKQ
jgi:transcriptional regulator with XRE-family HTH domain